MRVLFSSYFLEKDKMLNELPMCFLVAKLFSLSVIFFSPSKRRNVKEIVILGMSYLYFRGKCQFSVQIMYVQCVIVTLENWTFSSR